MRKILLLLVTAVIAHAAVSAERIADVQGLLRDRKIAEAEIATKALLRAHPAEAEVHALLGRVFTAQGDADAAVKACQKATELAPSSSTYQHKLGDAYGFAAQKTGMLSMMGLAKKSRIAYEKAVELDSKNLDARSSLMSFYQMAPSMVGGGVDKAYAQAAEIKKLDPARGRLAYGLIYVGEKKFAEAFAEFEAVLGATPDHYLALYQFGRAAALSGDQIDRGMEALKKCLTLPPTPGSPEHDAVHWRLGNLWEKNGDKSAARTAYEAALAINQNFKQAVDALKKLD